MKELLSLIGKEVSGVIDRPLGSRHPDYPDLVYKVNYGYIPEIIAEDGEYQDAYFLGVDVPLKTFKGVVIAVIHRLNDVEDKLVVAPKGKTFTKEEIEDHVYFIERYFEHEILY